MLGHKKYVSAILLLSISLFACRVSKNTSVLPTGINRLTLVNIYTIPNQFTFEGSTVGGLSGIDYDLKNNLFYFISDDRNALNPIRFYSAKIIITEKGIDQVQFVKKYPLINNSSLTSAENKNLFSVNPDPESIRYLPTAKSWVWSSEGERMVSAKNSKIANPFIIMIDSLGNLKSQFPLPENFMMQAKEIGPRRNGVWEGLSFTPTYKNLWVSTEEPLYEDGPRADLKPNSAYTRFIKYAVKNKNELGQYGYLLEPIALAPVPADGFKVNGISEILALSENTVLVMERSFSVGHQQSSIKVFLADFAPAQKLTRQPVAANKNFIPATKKLILNMDNLGVYIDNVEGLCFGPKLPNGKRSLIFISDNNFNPQQQTQLLLFEVN